MRAVSLSVSLAASAILGGCSLFVPRLETPQLSVVSVDLQKSDLWEQRMKVRMRVVNPNDRPIPVKGLTVALEVQGQELAHGVSGASFNVPALGEAEFDMNMTANMAGAIIKLLGKGDSVGDEISYRVTGKISLSEEGYCGRSPSRITANSSYAKPSQASSAASRRDRDTAHPGAARKNPASCRCGPCGPSGWAGHAGRARYSSPIRALRS